MKTRIYYRVKDGKLEEAKVRESDFMDECFEVKFEGRDWYSLVDKHEFLQTASVSLTEAKKMLYKSLLQKREELEIDLESIQSVLEELNRELSL